MKQTEVKQEVWYCQKCGKLQFPHAPRYPVTISLLEMIVCRECYKEYE